LHACSPEGVVQRWAGPCQIAPNLTLMPVKSPTSLDFVPAGGLLL
jgi:hypothetical protein